MVDAGGPATAESAGRSNLRLLVQLRWIAVFGQIATIVFTDAVLDVELPLAAMSGALAVLVGFAGFDHWRTRNPREITDRELFGSLLVDVAVLTVQLYLSGGAANPFVFLYLLQVGLGGALLPPRHAWALLAITTTAFIGLTIAHRPLPLAFVDADGNLDALFLTGLLLSFALTATLLLVYVTRIERNLRARDARLADLRQHAAEAEHIVRMGLLASGAAHELSTPLATLAVILGDWRRMAPFASDPELRQELSEMQTQVARCKSIVGGILLSAGQARGESPVETTVAAFLDGLAADWRATRPGAVLDLVDQVPAGQTLFADDALEQMICNVLDNALEASPGWVGLTARRTGDRLELTIRDAGPGFATDILDRIGQPYHSTKRRPGAGLGLFLATNVARRLGGTLAAANRPEGGAIVTITLPLAAIAREPPARPPPARAIDSAS
ncbi:MAG: ATP-binding protein [Lautropia sp.]